MKELSLVFLAFLFGGLMVATVIVIGWGLVERNPAVIAAAGGAMMVYIIFGRSRRRPT